MSCTCIRKSGTYRPRPVLRRVPLRQVYCAELGFNVASAFILAAWETRRKDFWVMMLHHGVTTVLISLSYYLKCALDPNSSHGDKLCWTAL